MIIASLTDFETIKARKKIRRIILFDETILSLLSRLFGVIRPFKFNLFKQTNIFGRELLLSCSKGLSDFSACNLGNILRESEL